MKAPTRLRLERIAKRTKKQVREINAKDAQQGDNVLADAASAQREMEQKRKRPSHPFGSSYLELYNVHQADFIRVESDGSITPMELSKGATHVLTPTSWNKDNKKQKAKKQNPLPSWWALSVCAVPLKPRVKQTALEVRKKFPKDAHAYNPAAGVEGKRVVLLSLIVAMRAKFKKSLVAKMTGEECDALYHGLKRASLQLKQTRLSEKQQRQQPSDILTS